MSSFKFFFWLDFKMCIVYIAVKLFTMTENAFITNAMNLSSKGLK